MGECACAPSVVASLCRMAVSTCVVTHCSSGYVAYRIRRGSLHHWTKPSSVMAASFSMAQDAAAMAMSGVFTTCRSTCRRSSTSAAIVCRVSYAVKPHRHASCDRNARPSVPGVSSSCATGHAYCEGSKRVCIVRTSDVIKASCVGASHRPRTERHARACAWGKMASHMRSTTPMRERRVISTAIRSASFGSTSGQAHISCNSHGLYTSNSA